MFFIPVNQSFSVLIPVITLKNCFIRETLTTDKNVYRLVEMENSKIYEKDERILLSEISEIKEIYWSLLPAINLNLLLLQRETTMRR